MENADYVVSAQITGIEKRYQPKPKHYVYIIKVTRSNTPVPYTIYRRYAQFFELNCELLDLFAEKASAFKDDSKKHEIPNLPSKVLFGRSHVRQVAMERKDLLNDYCQKLIALPESISRCHQVLSFFHPLETDVEKPPDPNAINHNIPKKDVSFVNEAPKIETYVCVKDFAPSENWETPLKENDVVEVMEKSENGLWLVRFNNNVGLVPAACLKLVTAEENITSEKTTESSANETYIVDVKYSAQMDDEISLEPGSIVTLIERSYADWWTVSYNGKTGRFPATYMSKYDNSGSSTNRPNTLLDSATNTTDTDENVLEADWDDDEDVASNSPSRDCTPELYYVHADFINELNTDLSLRRGDAIEIFNKQSNDWWSGVKVNKKEKLLWVPRDYLQKEPVINSNPDNSADQSITSRVDSRTTNDDTSKHPVQQSQNASKTFSTSGNTDSTPYHAISNIASLHKPVKDNITKDDVTLSQNAPITASASSPNHNKLSKIGWAKSHFGKKTNHNGKTASVPTKEDSK